MNLDSQLALTRLRGVKQTRFSPLLTVTDPTQITRRIDSFAAGYSKEAVNICDALEQSEDLIFAVVSKRPKAVERESWTVLLNDKNEKVYISFCNPLISPKSPSLL